MSSSSLRRGENHAKAVQSASMSSDVPVPGVVRGGRPARSAME